MMDDHRLTEIENRLTNIESLLVKILQIIETNNIKPPSPIKWHYNKYRLDWTPFNEGAFDRRKKKGNDEDV